MAEGEIGAIERTVKRVPVVVWIAGGVAAIFGYQWYKQRASAATAHDHAIEAAAVHTANADAMARESRIYNNLQADNRETYYNQPAVGSGDASDGGIGVGGPLPALGGTPVSAGNYQSGYLNSSVLDQPALPAVNSAAVASDAADFASPNTAGFETTSALPPPDLLLRWHGLN